MAWRGDGKGGMKGSERENVKARRRREKGRERGEGRGEQRGRPVTGGGRLAAYRKQETKPDRHYRHARIYPGQPIRSHQCRNPGRPGKCHPGRREAAGPFKDWMPSFHFSVLKFSPAPPNYLLFTSARPLFWLSSGSPPKASHTPLPPPFSPSSAGLKKGFPRIGPRNFPLLSPGLVLVSCTPPLQQRYPNELTAPPTPPTLFVYLPSAAG